MSGIVVIESNLTPFSEGYLNVAAFTSPLGIRIVAESIAFIPSSVEGNLILICSSWQCACKYIQAITFTSHLGYFRFLIPICSRVILRT
ncbi:hypothetical protein D3C87_1710140 [compost metagenome]